jgi:hypothetical protein
MIKNRFLSILSILAIPLALGLGALYQTYTESHFPKANELIVKWATLNSFTTYEKNVVFYFSANDSDFVFNTTEETTQLLNLENLRPFSAIDTFFIGYYPGKNSEIITLAKNAAPIITYQDYENKMWEEIKWGPLAAAIFFLGLTALILVLIVISPYIKRGQQQQIRKKLLEIEGLTQASDLRYRYVLHGYEMLITHVHNVSFHARANYNYLNIHIPLPDEFEKPSKQRLLKRCVKYADGKFWLIIDFQMPFGLNKKRLLKKLNKKIDLINSIAKA